MHETLRDLRRAQIVNGARSLVAEEGLHGFTIAALEARLDFTRGVITHHFQDKDEIVQAVLDSALAEIDSSTARGVRVGGSFKERLRGVLETKVRGFAEHPEASRILVAFWGRLSADPVLASRNARIFSRYRAEARLLLADHRDPEAASAILVGVVIGLVTQSLFDPSSVNLDRALDTACNALSRAWA